jgi:hypothetical protein
MTRTILETLFEIYGEDVVNFGYRQAVKDYG